MIASITGQASAPNAEIVGLYAKEVANKAWEVASSSNIKATNQKPSSTAPSVGDSGKRLYSTSATDMAGLDIFFVI